MATRICICVTQCDGMLLHAAPLVATARHFKRLHATARSCTPLQATASDCTLLQSARVCTPPVGQIFSSETNSVPMGRVCEAILMHI